MSIWSSIEPGDSVLDAVPERNNYTGQALPTQPTSPGERLVDVAVSTMYHDCVRLSVGYRAVYMLDPTEVAELIRQLTAAQRQIVEDRAGHQLPPLGDPIWLCPACKHFHPPSEPHEPSA